MQSTGPKLFIRTRGCGSSGTSKITPQSGSFVGNVGPRLFLDRHAHDGITLKKTPNTRKQCKLGAGCGYSSTLLLCGQMGKIGTLRGFTTSKEATTGPRVVHIDTRAEKPKTGVKSKSQEKHSAVEQESKLLKQQAIELHEGELSLFGFRNEPTMQAKLAYLWKFGKEIGSRIWNGFKDLWRNFVEANKLRRKRREGTMLTRKEERFIRQNIKDLKNLVPFFLVWRIPIFGDFILPFFIAKFPYLLPSTFKLVRTPTTEERVRANKLKQLSLLGEVHRGTFDPEMLDKMNQCLPLNETISASKVIANGELLDANFSAKDLNRNQLAALCSMLNLGTRTIGFFLRVRYYAHMTYIRQDDRILRQEGLESLSEQDLIDACLERGLKVLGLSKEQLKEQLAAWVELSIQHPKLLTPLLVYAHTYEQRDLCLKLNGKQSKNE